LFELGKDGSTQLAKCLLSSSTELTSSITHGMAGTSTSFYYCLCEELLSQDQAAFESVVADVVNYLTQALSKVETVLDSGMDGGGLVIVSALTALCIHKKAAHVLTQMPNFLLPQLGTVKATELVTPPPPTMPQGATSQQQQLFRLMQAMNRNQGQGYLKRSGPALEKDTILGQVLRLGCPRDHPSVTSGFPSVMASLDSVEKAADQQRRQLRVYQDTANNLMRSLVTAGPDARQQVMQWVIDALLVNTGASAMRPDPAKVSKTPTLINISVVLLKLCEPFMDSSTKAALIDANFVASSADHGGVYSTVGDDAVARLGGATSTEITYDPKNKFIPQCFFFAARSLHLGVVPLSAFTHNLHRNINHTAYTLQQRNSDLASDPNFSHLISLQRANEVTLYSDEMLSATLNFCNVMAQFLTKLDASQLGMMPEHFVDDICEILRFLAKSKPKHLSGHDYGNIFRMVVKLLSPEFSSVSLCCLSCDQLPC